jgi:hypothetical protein
MAHLSDLLKGLLSRRPPGGGQPAGGIDDAREGASTLYQLVRAERSAAARSARYCKHEYELALWQSRRLYVVEMRSRMRYTNWDGTIGRPWVYRATFDTLPAARNHAAEVLDDPRRYGDVDRDRSTGSAWDAMGRGRDQKRTSFSYERPASLDDGTLAESIAAGHTPYLAGPPPGQMIAPSFGEVVRQLWGRTEPSARATLLSFARDAPLRYGHWSHWKWLYKRAEEASDRDLLAVLIARIDAATPAEPGAWSWLEQAPRAATLAYMKRRARRALQLLAERDPAAYVEVAGAILLEAGRGRSELDPTYNWVTFDILYGGSGRYVQTGHSRGRYVARRTRPSPGTHDERAPEAWSLRPELLAQLYADATLPWQTQEWAYQMLVLRGMALPALSEDTLMRFLQGSSPLLIRVAVASAMATLEAGAQPAPRVLALALCRANGAQRKRAIARLLWADVPAQWERDFARALGEVLQAYTTGARFPARLLDVALLLGTRYAALAPVDVLLVAIPALLATAIPELVELARQTINHLSADGILAVLQEGVALDDAQRGVLADLLVAARGARGLQYWQFYQLVFADHAWVRAVGWRLAAVATGRTREQIAWLWTIVLSKQGPALASAIASADALRLLAPDKLEGLAARMGKEPELVAALSAESFAFLAQRFPLETVLSFVAGLPDDVWTRVRERFLAALRTDGRLGAFWRAVAAVDAPIALVTRIVGDPVVAPSFDEVAEPGYLERSNGLMGPLLHAWVAAHPNLFTRGSRPLLLAAMNKDPEIRAWALRRVEEVGLTTPFALRLLESGLPEAVEAGKRYFDAVPPGSPDELDSALAICDSGDRATQAYGRAYIAARRDTLPRDTLIRRLAEHPDPRMQETVAAALLETPALARDLRAFDRGVLRARDRGRRAKEKVKERLAATPAPDLHADRATLLELARGQTGRDKEWAIEQLARLALAGEPVEGVAIDGVGGI